MEIVYLNEDESFVWDSFVQSSPQASVFALTWYLDSLQVDYNILTIKDNDCIIAGLILSKNQINTYSNPSLVKYLGVVFRKEVPLNHKKISQQYKAMGLLASELKGYKSFDYYFHPEFKNWIPFYWNGFAQETRYTYQINLKLSSEEIHKRFHGNLKNDIKHALNHEVKIRSNIDFEDLYDVVNKTFLRQGSKAPFNKNKLENFIKALSKKQKFISFGAYTMDGTLISVCGLVSDDNSSYFILNGIVIEKQLRGANALMIFEAIKYQQNKDLTLFDFEGSMLPGVEPFYRRFGGELTAYYRIWNDNLFNYTKTKAKKLYKKIRYGR
jgi:hypothetical protein